jgi:hypothetical protein
LGLVCVSSSALPSAAGVRPRPAQPLTGGAVARRPRLKRHLLGTSVGDADPAQKNKFFLAQVSHHFCLFFFEKRGEFSEKNKQKTRFANRTPQYRVGVFNKSCFLLIFFEKFTAFFKKK